MNQKPDSLYKVGIVGYGVVGKGIHRLFGESVRAIYDPYIGDADAEYASDLDYPYSEYKHTNTFEDKKKFKDLDLIVVCVMTKENKDGTCDMSIVEETAEWVSKVNRKAIFLVKSTSLPNDLERIKKKYKLRLVFSPEYMGESKYFTPFWKYPDPFEMKYHEFQIFGGDPKDASECIDIFIRVMGPHVKFHITDIKTASLAKYMENTFFATKVTFCNEWYDIAKSYDVDYNELRDLWLLDSRISPMHTAVFPKDRGYGGKCYPKDLKAIVVDVEKVGYKAELLLSVNKVNKKIRKVKKDEPKRQVRSRRTRRKNIKHNNRKGKKF